MEIKQTPAFVAWFEELKDKRAQARIAMRITRFANNNFGDVKPVGRGVSEARIDVGPGYRVYFICKGSILVVLLCGGDKSTQQADIKRAHELAEELD